MLGKKSIVLVLCVLAATPVWAQENDGTGPAVESATSSDAGTSGAAATDGGTAEPTTSATEGSTEGAGTTEGAATTEGATTTEGAATTEGGNDATAGGPAPTVEQELAVLSNLTAPTGETPVETPGEETPGSQPATNADGTQPVSTGETPGNENAASEGGLLGAAAQVVAQGAQGQLPAPAPATSPQSTVTSAQNALDQPIASMGGPSAVRRDELIRAAQQVSAQQAAVQQQIAATQSALADARARYNEQIRMGHAGPSRGAMDSLAAELSSLQTAQSQLNQLRPRLISEANWYNGRAQGPSIGAPSVPPLPVRLFGPPNEQLGTGTFWQGLNLGGGVMLPNIPGPGVNVPNIPRPFPGGNPAGRP